MTEMNIYKNYLSLLFVLFALVVLPGCAPMTAKDSSETQVVASTADGSAIRYGVRGQGDVTLVFVHCWTCNHTFWDKQVEHFSRNYRVVWLDLAGHGESGSRRESYTMQAFGQDVASVVEAVGAQRVILVGHSMGGPVSVEAAKRLGDRVLGVVGVDTFYTGFEYPKTEAEIAAMIKPFEDDFATTTKYMIDSMFTPAADPSAKEWVLTQFDGSKKSMGISAMYGLLRWNAAGRLEQYQGRLRNINAAPTGKEQPLHHSVVLIPGVGHFVPQVKPDEFNAALQSIVNEFTTQ
jgi:pimeloyl-ACP methyl ester carboxylesterase